MRIDREKLFECMAEKGFFIKDVCKKLNVNEPSLKRILAQGEELDDRIATKMAIVLKVKLKDIEKEEGES